MLIESHADIDVKDSNGKIPLFFAAQNGKHITIEFIVLRASYTIRMDVFVWTGHFEAFKLLIQEHEKRNIGFINITDIMGMSLLHFAAMNKKPNNVEIVKILLEKSPNVNSIARDNTTPLDFAATTG